VRRIRWTAVLVFECVAIAISSPQPGPLEGEYSATGSYTEPPTISFLLSCTDLPIFWGPCTT